MIGEALAHVTGQMLATIERLSRDVARKDKEISEIRSNLCASEESYREEFQRAETLKEKLKKANTEKREFGDRFRECWMKLQESGKVIRQQSEEIVRVHREAKDRSALASMVDSGPLHEILTKAGCPFQDLPIAERLSASIDMFTKKDQP